MAFFMNDPKSSSPNCNPAHEFGSVQHDEDLAVNSTRSTLKKHSPIILGVINEFKKPYLHFLESFYTMISLFPVSSYNQDNLVFRNLLEISEKYFES
ncbi:Hypothetical predicted protein [Octopus vulgaris]|uniref:Uncharacterized protein n=1 Tax=Octopus vulgaris TaxID=6645 RepID=A0AA36BKZ8_OCTVU|nr:Hypothetical predicted protein [Octopus vulgaris]